MVQLSGRKISQETSKLKKESANNLTFFIFSAFLLTGAYFVSRLVNLTIIPIFTDEAIYLRWAQIALADPRWRLISLVDGKQPLFIWLLLPLVKYISDPLIAGRLLSVISGFFSMVGIGLFSWCLTQSRKAGLVAALTYLLVPFFLMYDRLAIYDSLLTTITIWVLFFTYLLGKTLRIDVALILGSAIGAGLLTKSSAYYFLILLPSSLLLVAWKKKTWKSQFIRWLGLGVIVLVQSQIYYNIMRLSEFRHIIAEKNLTFIYSWSEFIYHPLKSFPGNLRGLTIWLVAYLTIPLSLFILISIYQVIQRNWRMGIFFASWFFIPFLSLAFFGRVIYPRFVVFMVPPLLMIATLYFWQMQAKYAKRTMLLIGLVILLPLIFFDIKLLADPVKASLPHADRQQYLNDWPAGYGIKEVVQYLEQESQHGPVIVGTEGTFGLFPMALELYLKDNENVTFKAFWPVVEVPPELQVDALSKPTYMIFKERQDIPDSWSLELIAQYQRGDGDTYLRFYRVLP